MNQALGFRASVADPGLAGLYDLWDGLRRTLGRLPNRRDIDPLDLAPGVLPGMLILEKESTGRFRCRLAGTLLTDIYGFEPTGWYLDEVMPPAAATVREGLYERVLREQRAALCRIRFAVPGREFIASDRLYVPAFGDSPGEPPTFIFSAQSFLTAAEVAGEPDADGIYHLRFEQPVFD